MSWWKIAVLAILGVIILGIIMLAVNRKYKRKYNYSLYKGGIVVLLCASLGVFGYVLIKTNSIFGIGLISLAAVILLIVALINIKRCGVFAGIGGLLLQIICCVPCFFGIFTISRNSNKFSKDKIHNSKGKNRYYNEENYLKERRKQKTDEYKRNYEITNAYKRGYEKAQNDFYGQSNYGSYNRNNYIEPRFDNGRSKRKRRF